MEYGVFFNYDLPKQQAPNDDRLCLSQPDIFVVGSCAKAFNLKQKLRTSREKELRDEERREREREWNGNGIRLETF